MDSNNHVHVFKATVVPATCKENGYTLHRCACGYEHKDNFTQLAPHNFRVVEETLPTCEHGGSRTFCCAVCGETRTETSAPMGHSFGPWKIQDFPTCTEAGKQIRICSRCGYKEESVLPATGHKLTSPKKSATQKGYKDYFCENCGQTISVQSAFQKHKKKIIAAIISVVLMACLCAAAFLYIIPAIHYYCAIDYIDEGNYTEAYYSLKECDGFKDSSELLADFICVYEEVKITYFDDDGEITNKEKIKYEYDENGNETLYVRYDKDGNIAYKTESKYEYDEKGNKTLSVDYDEDGNITYKHEYDEHGNMTLSVWYDKYGNITDKFEYEHDENGNKTLRVWYDEDGNITDKTEYEYDENGNETLSVSYDEDGNITDKTEYEYDENGNMTLWVSYDEDGNITDKTEYYEDGMLSVEYDEDGKITSKTETEFEDYDDGFKMIYVDYDEDGEITGKTEYEYSNLKVIYKPEKK